MGDHPYYQEWTMPRPKKAERAEVLGETRQRLLTAATEEFARLGYEAANIDRISQAAGFAKGTIYNYFPSKRDLMLSLIESVSTLHLEYVAERVRREEDPARRLERFFEAGFNFISDYLPQSQVMIGNLYGPDPQFKETMYHAYLPMFDLVGSEIIAEGIEQGIFRQVAPQATAALLMTIYLGTASQVNEEGRPWQSASQLADFVLNGLRC
jgi:AcrR family transcriptional regulator